MVSAQTYIDRNRDVGYNTLLVIETTAYENMLMGNECIFSPQRRMQKLQFFTENRQRQNATKAPIRDRNRSHEIDRRKYHSQNQILIFAIFQPKHARVFEDEGYGHIKRREVG